MDAGDTDAIVSTFTPDGYYREPIGPPFVHRGASELRSFFSWCFSAGGGIGLEHCSVTDDGTRSALEYNCIRWGSHDLPPQAGITVFDPSQDGLVAAARVYDDVKAAVNAPQRPSVSQATNEPAERSGSTWTGRRTPHTGPRQRR